MASALRRAIYTRRFLLYVKQKNNKISVPCSTAASPSIRADSARLCASAFAWPVDSTAADKACNSRSCFRTSSASASSLIRWRSNKPLAFCSRREASCLAAASCELVVI